VSRKVTRLRFLAGSLGGVRAASATHSFPTVLVLLNHTQPIQYQYSSRPVNFSSCKTPQHLLCSRLMMVLKRLLQGTPAHCKLLQGGRFVHQCVGPWGQSPHRESHRIPQHFKFAGASRVVCVLYKEIFPIPVVPKIPQLMLPDLLLDLCASPPQGIAALMALIDGHHNWKPLVTTVGISR
jgi:hypothetical protein